MLLVKDEREEKMNEKELNLNPSFHIFSVYSFIHSNASSDENSKLKDFRVKKVDKFANHVIEIYLISVRWFDLG